MEKESGNNRYLFTKLVVLDIKKRYQGSVLGILWAILVPLIMLSIYTFVFSEVFSAKWNIDTDNKFEFALMLFCGLCIYNMFSEVVSRSVSLIEQNQNYVKKVVFPIHILPVVITFSALFNCILSVIVLIGANLAITGRVFITAIEFPIILVPHILLCIGFSYFFSAIAVYLKDVASIIPVIITMFMYLTPVFFPLASVPEGFRAIMMINPMTYTIENMRRVILYGSNINWQYLVIATISAAVISILGRMLFMKARSGFADLL